MGDPNRERRGRRLKRANFQSGTCETIERLGNHCNASPRFDRRDETGNAVVFLDNLRRTIQWRKQVCDPCLMLWIVRKGESNETLFGDLFQSDSARSRQWVRRMHCDANQMALQFLENQSFQSLWRHLHQQGRMELSFTEFAQHFLRG